MARSSNPRARLATTPSARPRPASSIVSANSSLGVPNNSAPIDQGWLPRDFAPRVIAWEREHGRRGLPWQVQDPYRVWLSEIMLQQTQVSSALEYFPRFVARFADVFALAAAPLEAVMQQWAGLGYYSRARNLHRCAQTVVQLHGGVFPGSAKALEALPGIGRSTASAIAAFCFGERAPILDANVKRLLWRVFALAPSVSNGELWALSEALLPAAGGVEFMAPYTQGVMDLGALVCKARGARCGDCPLSVRCMALERGGAERFGPVKAMRRRERLDLVVLLARNGHGRVWLAQQRDFEGILGSIWSGLDILPVYPDRSALLQALGPALGERVQWRAPFVHTLTHRDMALEVGALALEAPEWSTPPMTAARGIWFSAEEARSRALPAPFAKLLKTLDP